MPGRDLISPQVIVDELAPSPCIEGQAQLRVPRAWHNDASGVKPPSAHPRSAWSTARRGACPRGAGSPTLCCMTQTAHPSAPPDSDSRGDQLISCMARLGWSRGTCRARGEQGWPDVTRATRPYRGLPNARNACTWRPALRGASATLGIPAHHSMAWNEKPLCKGGRRVCF